MEARFNPLQFYTELPVVTRSFVTLAFGLTALCALEVVSPFTLYFNPKLVMEGQVWRLATTFLFFGNFGIDFVFHMYFLVQYSRLLERNSFANRSAEFVFFLLFGAVLMLAASPFVSMHFFSFSLTFTLVYLWAKRNRDVRVNLLGVFTFTAPWFPWVLIGFSLIFGNSIMVDLLGIAVGHVYFCLMDVFPAVARSRGWTCRRALSAPRLLYLLTSTPLPAHMIEADRAAARRAAGPGAGVEPVAAAAPLREMPRVVNMDDVRLPEEEEEEERPGLRRRAVEAADEPQPPAQQPPERRGAAAGQGGGEPAPAARGDGGEGGENERGRRVEGLREGEPPHG